MEIEEYRPQEQDPCASCPRGGPVYDPDFVGPITCVPEFEISVVEELQSLEAELCMDTELSFEEELSVDELKILTEEELVDKAFKEAFKDEQNKSSSQVPEEHCNEMRTDDPRTSSSGSACLGSSGKECSTPESHESSSPFKPCSEKVSGTIALQDSKMKKKRGRAFDRNCRAAELYGPYLAKVEELAKIKKKQDEDKAAARLHSFNGSVGIVEATISASEKNERMKSRRFSTSTMKVKSSSTHVHVPVCYPDVILSIEIYHNRKKNIKTQEFLVLGRQTLTELRDSIYCATDQLMQRAGQYDPSGYFLVNDVFYNDLRNPSAIDYTEPIFNWLRNCKDEALKKWEYAVISAELRKKQRSLIGSEAISRLPNFKAVDMHRARFCDLQFRVGCGYLYCHQGNCQHTIVIRDMRLFHPDDVQNRAAYPVLTFQLRPRHQKCSICKIFIATKVTVDNKWAQNNPSYFCDNCYFLLHYKEDGSLLYNEFTVHDYHHE